MIHIGFASVRKPESASASIWPTGAQGGAIGNGGMIGALRFCQHRRDIQNSSSIDLLQLISNNGIRVLTIPVVYGISSSPVFLSGLANQYGPVANTRALPDGYSGFL